jgi:dihydropteroate synthase
MILATKTKQLALSTRAVIMGILNTTPDSFSDGGKFHTAENACQHALQMIQQGAEIIDIGGESTRPGACEISAEEEILRVIPVISALRQQWNGWISIDTTKSVVAAAAIAAGADIINDISGLEADPQMAHLCRDTGCACVIMHRQGTPITMQLAPHYQDVIAEIAAYFQQRYQTLIEMGISPEQLCFDPGIGFGKSVAHNCQILQHLSHLPIADRPLLLGVSRKSFIAKLLNDSAMSSRSWPTIALTSHGRMQGAMIHRVHEVEPNLQALRMIEAIQAHHPQASC